MSYFDQVKDYIDFIINDELLISIVCEMSKSFDADFTTIIRTLQEDTGITVDAPTRKLLRKKYYYGEYFNLDIPFTIPHFEYSSDDIERIFEDCYSRLNTYDSNKILMSIRTRFENLNNNTTSDDNMDAWLDYYNVKRSNKLYSFAAFRLDQTIFSASGYNENIITDFILKTYDGLENYRHLALITQGEIFNEQNECITWKLLYKAGIFAENFIQFTDRYNPYKKDSQISNLESFLEKRNICNASSLARSFYSSISTGYKFEDCYISDNQDIKILIYKKIELDETNVPCPSCNTTIQRKNSYPQMFQRSWECNNPSCAERSKSGRGKRFDEYGVYRYFKLVENDINNLISTDLYQEFRRDVFDHNNNWTSFLIKEYTYSDEMLFMCNCTIDNNYNRELINPDINQMPIPSNAVLDYSQLPIVAFYEGIIQNTIFKTGDRELVSDIEIINGDSSQFIQTLSPGQIGTAITSPPYYNAREYSQWDTLIMYFVDMIINCKTIFDSLAPDSYYLYNIGDVVQQDNIYVVSKMSEKRIQLGFFSSMIFEIAGFTLTGNIIWDKGEVESKRASTVNLISGYVNCINCYEHILVFRKGRYERTSNSVEQIAPVIKINSRGQNTYKHTAPYPPELVELVRPYVNQDLYILDPFLGSGTTLKWCRENNLKGLGIELNPEYYQLCLTNI